MNVLSLLLWTTNQDRFGNKVGRKSIQTGMTQRKDVVLKCLLRRIRKAIRNNFFQMYSRSLNKNEKNYKVIEVHLRKYISQCMNKVPSEEFVETLGVFICLENIEAWLHKISTQKYNSQLDFKINSLRSLLYKFNFSRFLDILKMPHMSNVILHFEQIQRLDKLSNNEKVGFQIISDEWIKRNKSANI